MSCLPRPIGPRTPAEQHLWDHLTQRRDTATDLRPQGYAYANPCDFVLQHGRWYAPRPLPRPVTRGVPNHCYGNAMVRAVLHDLAYVEGYALLSVRGEPPMLFQHAWCADAEGRLYEVTWKLLGLAYLGVTFGVERADDCTWNGDATVLHDDQRGWPLLRQRWTGEPLLQAWPPSPRLALLQASRRA